MGGGWKRNRSPDSWTLVLGHPEDPLLHAQPHHRWVQPWKYDWLRRNCGCDPESFPSCVLWALKANPSVSSCCFQLTVCFTDVNSRIASLHGYFSAGEALKVRSFLWSGRNRGAIISQYYNRTMRLRRHRQSRPSIKDLSRSARPSIRGYGSEEDTTDSEGEEGASQKLQRVGCAVALAASLCYSQ